MDFQHPTYKPKLRNPDILPCVMVNSLKLNNELWDENHLEKLFDPTSVQCIKHMFWASSVHLDKII